MTEVGVPEALPLALWQHLGEPERFTWIELSGQGAVVRRVYRRDWTASGLRIVPEWSGDPEAIPGALLAGTVVATRSRGPDRSIPVLDSLYRRCPDLRLVDPGRDLVKGTAAPEVSPFRIALRGSEDLILDNVTLPLEVRVACRGDRRELHRLGVDASPHRNLPAPGWFRVPAGPDARLRIDVRPGPDGDRWEVTRIEDGYPLDPVPADRALAPDGVLPGRLAVVLDRTCPDREWRGAAEHLARHGSAPEDAPSVSAWNLELRAGAAAALARELAPRGARLDAWWVADVIPEGMGVPEGVTDLKDPVGELGSAGGASASALLGGAGYHPGYDLFDPIERALERILERVEAENPPELGILVMGNSPPSLPWQATSPLAALRRVAGGPAEARRRSGAWHRCLDRFRSLGIPVVYLFLTGEAPGAGAAKGRSDLERKVIEALAGTVELVQAGADREGADAGVRESLRRLGRRLHPASTVEVTA